MEHKILYFDENLGKLTVSYKDLVTITVDIPIENGKYLAGDKLTSYLVSIAPVWDVERTERLKAIERGIENAHVIRGLVEDIKTPEVTKSTANDLFTPVAVGQTHETNHKLNADKEYIKELIKEILGEQNTGSDQ